MDNFNFNNRDNRRPIVAIVIAVLVVLGIVGISNASYQSGVMQGMMIGAAQAPQVVVPNANGDGAQVVPAPRAAPYNYPAPYYGQHGFGRGGWGGGFSILGVLFNVLLIGGILFLVSRLFFRGFGWGRWGRGWGGPGGPRGPWGWGGRDEDRRDDNDKRDGDKPNKRDGEVI